MIEAKRAQELAHDARLKAEVEKKGKMVHPRDYFPPLMIVL